jgi:hypothetical protein
MTRFVVLLLFFFAAVILTSEAKKHKPEKDLQNSVEASELQPEKVAARRIIPGATRGIRPVAEWNNHWKFRCPSGMKRSNLGLCRIVW